MRQLQCTCVAVALLSAGCAQVRPGQTAATADVFDRYVAAVGGAQAVRALSSRASTGELLAGPNRAPLEIHQATPARFLRVLRNTQTKLSENGFDGTTAWSRNDGQFRKLGGPEVENFKREYHLHRPVLLRSEFARVEQIGDTTIEGQAVSLVRGALADGSSELLYFDRATGLWFGWDRTVQGVLIETRYQDYRDVGGVKVPFRVERRRPGFRWVEQAAEIRHNAPIDSTRFSPTHRL